MQKSPGMKENKFRVWSISLFFGSLLALGACTQGHEVGESAGRDGGEAPAVVAPSGEKLNKSSHPGDATAGGPTKEAGKPGEAGPTKSNKIGLGERERGEETPGPMAR